MTNFKNPFASTKRSSQRRNASCGYNLGKKAFDKRVFLSRFFLLIICFNFAVTALAAGGGRAGLNAAAASAGGASSPMGPASPLAPMGPTPPSTTGGRSGLNQAAANASGAPVPLNAGGRAGLNQAAANAANTNLVVQEAESNASNFSWLTNLLNWASGDSDDNAEAQGLQYFWENTLRKWIENIGSLLQQLLDQLVIYVIEPIAQLLTGLLIQFAYNPDVSVGTDSFSKNVQDLAKWVQFVANDLLLLFFLLSIWRYWANAAWKGGSMMGAVARIIVAASATTAWPTIYHYVILISNSLTQYLISQNVINATTIASAVARAITDIATGKATLSFVGTMLSSGQLNFWSGLAIPIIALAQLMLVIAIGLAIIGSIVVFFTMKVIQLIIIIAAFVFAPFFLCLLVSPDTDSVVSGFIRSFVESSLWTFVWTIFLMLFIFIATSNVSGADVNGHLNVSQNPQNPWFVLFLELGILQAMIQTPGYLSRGKISEAGEFLEIFALWKIGKSAANMMFGADGYGSRMFRYAKRNNPLTKDKDSASISLGGKGVLPEGGKQLASLNAANKSGFAAATGGSFVPGAFASKALAAAAGASSTGTPSTGRNPLTASVAGVQARAAGMQGMAGARPGQGPVAKTMAQAQAAAAAAMGMGGIRPGQGPVASSMAQAQARAATAMGVDGASGGTIDTGDSGGSIPGGISPLGAAVASASRGALGQFGASVGGSQGAASRFAPAVQKTSIGLMSNSNPWHDTRGRKMSAVDYLAAFNLGSVRTGKVSLSENKKNPHLNEIDFDDAGNIRQLKHREGAGAQEIGMMGTVAALASEPYSDGKGHLDARAVTATNNAVKDKGKWDMPLGRRMAYGLSGGRVPDYVKNIEKDRLEKEKCTARIEGAQAYVNGESGNAYTKFLRWKLEGPMNDETKSMLAYTSENTDATLGGFNLNLAQGIQRLGKMGMDINPVTMGIASHEGVIAMKPSEQPQAIPAVLQLVNSHLAAMGIDPGNKDIWNANSIHWAAADGVLRGITPQQTRAARAIADIAGISAVNPESVNAVMDMHRLSGQSEMAPGYEKMVLQAMGRGPVDFGRPQGGGRPDLARNQSSQGTGSPLPSMNRTFNS